MDQLLEALLACCCFDNWFSNFPKYTNYTFDYDVSKCLYTLLLLSNFVRVLWIINPPYPLQSCVDGLIDSGDSNFPITWHGHNHFQLPFPVTDMF